MTPLPGRRARLRRLRWAGPLLVAGGALFELAMWLGRHGGHL